MTSDLLALLGCFPIWLLPGLLLFRGIYNLLWKRKWADSIRFDIAEAAQWKTFLNLHPLNLHNRIRGCGHKAEFQFDLEGEGLGWKVLAGRDVVAAVMAYLRSQGYASLTLEEYLPRICPPSLWTRFVARVTGMSL